MKKISMHAKDSSLFGGKRDSTKTFQDRRRSGCVDDYSTLGPRFLDADRKRSFPFGAGRSTETARVTKLELLPARLFAINGAIL